jgi:hypothetical protein
MLRVGGDDCSLPPVPLAHESDANPSVAEAMDMKNSNRVRLIMALCERVLSHV